MTFRERINRAVEDAIMRVLNNKIEDIISDEIEGRLDDICIEDYVEIDDMVDASIEEHMDD